jgi:hypothetical protein
MYSSIILFFFLQVDKLDEECSAFLGSVGSSTTLDPAQQKVETVVIFFSFPSLFLIYYDSML